MIYNCKYCKRKKMWRVYSRKGSLVRLVDYAKNEAQANQMCWELNTQERLFG